MPLFDESGADQRTRPARDYLEVCRDRSCRAEIHASDRPVVPARAPSRWRAQEEAPIPLAPLPRRMRLQPRRVPGRRTPARTGNGHDERGPVVDAATPGPDRCRTPRFRRQRIRVRWFIRCDHSPTNASWFSSQPSCPSDSASIPTALAAIPCGGGRYARDAFPTLQATGPAPTRQGGRRWLRGLVADG